jgi:hypothetical protein
MQPEAAYTFPIRIGTRNEASNVKSITGALAFNVSLASTLFEKREFVGLEALEPSAPRVG